MNRLIHETILSDSFTNQTGQFNLHSKKCWAKYNAVLGNYWTEHMLGCFQPTVGLNV